MSPAAPEVWQRGPVPGYDAFLMPAVHAFLQVQEDLRALANNLSDADAWARPGEAASIAFHIRHIGGATDRLLTYARGEALTGTQREAMQAESAVPSPTPSLPALVEEAVAAIDAALAQLRATPRETLLEPRAVGRAQLPTSVLGLLFHAAEHATRHTGQAMTTARVLRG